MKSSDANDGSSTNFIVEDPMTIAEVQGEMITEETTIDGMTTRETAITVMITEEIGIKI